MKNFFLLKSNLVLLVVLAFSVQSFAELKPATKIFTGSSQVVNNESAIEYWYEPKNINIVPMPTERIQLNCAEKKLYSTHPQQMLKTYHQVSYARYNHFKLTGTDPACRLSSKAKNSSGKTPCLKADDLEYVVLSDTYTDKCGNLYRGVWDVIFTLNGDNMGTLFSRGRVMYQKPNSEFENDMYDAQTYSLDEKDFLFLSKLSAGDFEKIEKLRADSKRTHVFDSQTLLFTPK